MKDFYQLLIHAVNTPGNVVIGAPRQCGATRALLSLINPNLKVALISRTRNMQREHMKMIRDKIDFYLPSHINVVNETICLKTEKANDYDLILVDDVGYISEDRIAKLTHAKQVRIVMIGTGCNKESFHKLVFNLMSRGFSSVFANPKRHPYFLEQRRAECSDFEREYIVRNMTEVKDG